MPAVLEDDPRGLDERLGHYRRTTGRAQSSRPGGQVTRYAAATASALALAGSAEAAVIYSGVQNITIQNNPGGAPTYDRALIDLDGAFGDDVELGVSWYQYSRVSGGQYGTYFFYTNLANARAQALPNGAGILQNSTFQARRLSFGQTISAGGAFFAGAALRLNYYSEYHTPVFPGSWPGSGSGFLGVQIQRDGETHYGWIRLELEDLSSAKDGPEGVSDRITVVDWAYQSTADAPIQAGQTVPEPSTGALTLLATGAAGALTWRRRRSSQTGHDEPIA